jgi:hypothetical protein
MLEGDGQTIRLEPSIYVLSHILPAILAKRRGLLQRHVRRLTILTVQIGDQISGDGIQPS